MGTLRLKRGTKEALQTNPGFTPAEGELVYTTDSKEVFVGDGATQGGVPVSVSTQNLEDLGNVQALAAQKDQILVYTGSNWAATDNPAVDIRGNIYGDDSTLLVDAINGKIVGPVETSTVSATTLTGNLTGDTNGSHTGGVVGDVVGNVVGTVTGSLTGTMTGSVFGDDSSGLLVDGINNKITGAINAMNESTFDNTINIGTKVSNPAFNYNITSTNGAFPQSTIQIRNVHNDVTADELGLFRSRGTLGARTTVQANDVIGGFGWSAFDGSTVLIGANMNSIVNSVSSNNLSADLIIRTRNGAISTYGEAMRIKADKGVTTQGYIQFGSYTTTQRDALTAANGMVIYNSTDNKFQGYENGAWANLI